MPINASIHYRKAEQEYHEAETKQQKLKALKKMLATAPNHKGAENLRSQLKKRIAKLKYKKEKEIEIKKGAPSLAVPKKGAAQVAFVGLPNAGKSYILEKLSGAEVEQKKYPFTTKKPEVRMIDIDGAKLQGVEIPAIYEGFYDKDEGPEVFAVVRNADLVILVVDGREDVRKKIASLHSEFGRADIELTRERSGHQDMVTYIPGLILVNYQPDFSGKLNRLDVINFRDKKTDEIIKKVWAHIPRIRVYTRTAGKVAEKPVVLPKKSTVGELARHVHKDFVKNFKYAKVWGSGTFPGQQVGMEYVLKDKDVVELYMR